MCGTLLRQAEQPHFNKLSDRASTGSATGITTALTLWFRQAQPPQNRTAVGNGAGH